MYSLHKKVYSKLIVGVCGFGGLVLGRLGMVWDIMVGVNDASGCLKGCLPEERI